MRLKHLKIRNFRGFGSTEVEVPCHADLVLLFGPNGYGKTSLAEAVEWLLTGTTRRRQRGEEISKSEYGGTFPNAHNGTPVQVTATILGPDGADHHLTRSIPNTAADTVSILSLDGKTITTLEAVGSQFGGIVRNPVIAQHDLQSFIHSRPKERRDLIGAALGLEELTTLKTALDSARRTFSLNPPAEVETTRSAIRPLAPTLEAIKETKALGRRWQKSPPEVTVNDDLIALKEAARRLGDTTATDTATILEALRTKRRVLAETALDTKSLVPPSRAVTLDRFDTQREKMRHACEALSDAVRDVLGAAAAAYTAAMLRFWETGLQLTPEGDRCPMCEQPTLDDDVRRELSRRLKESQDVTQLGRMLTTTLETANSTVTALTAIAVCPPALPEVDRKRLETLFADDAEKVSAFLACYDAQTDALATYTEAKSALTSFLNKLLQRINNVENKASIEADIQAIPKALLDAAGKLSKAVSDYHDQWPVFEAAMNERISKSSDITEIDAVGKALRLEPQLRLIGRYNDVLKTAIAAVQATETYLRVKQEELLATHGARIKALYDRMNPGASVVFEGMEPATDQIRLHASTFGKRMPASANLSQCQLNCLGLAFWVDRTVDDTSPFSFILLDDPVQSMDDDHCEAFISGVIPWLCDDRKRQVIVLSHERDLVGRIRDLNKARSTLVYHFDEYAYTGPTITEQTNLNKMLAEIRSLSKGNEPSRSRAVDNLRKVVEQLVRDLHVMKLGTPLPPTLNGAQPGQLIEVFRTLPDTTPEDASALQDTCNFSSPDHHTNPGHSVPVTTNITPHIDRLHNLCKKYGLFM